MNCIRVLIVDDDEEDYLITRDLLSDLSSGTRMVAAWAGDPDSARRLMLPPSGEAPEHDICLLDYRLGRLSGLELLRQVRADGYRLPVILLTGSEDYQVDQEALAAGASDYLIKGRNEPALLERSIRYAIAQKAAEETLRATARALEEARQREAEVGSAIQKHLLLPPVPEGLPAGISVGAYMVGAEKVTGDYCDFQTFREPCLDVILGDVMGKGIGAALVGAAVKSQLQRVTRRLTSEFYPYRRLPEPQEIIGALNAVMVRELNALDCFVTLVYVRFHLERRSLTFVDAGHTGVLQRRASDGAMVFLRGDNVPMGVSVDECYTQTEVAIEPGDLFVLYSDGLTEAADAQGEFFGEERLAALLEQASDLEPGQVAHRLETAIDGWKADKGDDLTCLVIKIGELASIAAPRPTYRVAEEFVSEPESLEAVRRFVESICLRADLEERADHVVLGINEAAGNIIEHAYAGRSGETLRIEARIDCSGVEFHLQDRGKSFDLQAVAEPDFDGGQDGGFGWFLIRQCFDNVRYERDEFGYNHLSLRIHAAD